MIISVYKPKGPTSHDIINQIRKITGVKKVGHAGTLDPLASGILVIAIGRESTKQLANIVAKEKEYVAEIKLGINSSTDDEEGVKTIVEFKNKPTLLQIEQTLQKFIGTISQIPPIYSAIKIKGAPAYKFARHNQEIEMQPRLVKIKEIEILNYAWPILLLRVVTGPGTYIRSLARDIGQTLKTGAYLSNLERTRVGAFTKETTIPLDEIPRLMLP